MDLVQGEKINTEGIYFKSMFNYRYRISQMMTQLRHLFLPSVRCFSANCTILCCTIRPLRRRTWSMYLRARFSLSAFSPQCRYSSSVLGDQNGSTSITCRHTTTQKHRVKKTALLVTLYRQGVSSFENFTYLLQDFYPTYQNSVNGSRNNLGTALIKDWEKIRKVFSVHLNFLFFIYHCHIIFLYRVFFVKRNPSLKYYQSVVYSL